MPGLLDLPNEVLLQIIGNTNVEDIESFSSCNKRIRSLFEPALQLHMKRKIKYSKTELGCSQTQINPHAVTLLRDVLESPAIALYPRNVVIGECVDVLDTYWPGWFPGRSQAAILEIKDAIARSTELLSAHLDACPYIRTSDKQRWKREICEGKERTSVIFLIMLFPNLESITIFGASYCMSEAVENIAAAQQKYPESTHPLQYLTTVRLEQSSQPSGVWFDYLEPFTSLKSVRLLAGKLVQGLYTDYSIMDVDDDSDEDSSENEDADNDELEEEEDHKEDNDDVEKDAQIEEGYKHKIVESGGGITRLSFRDSAIDASKFNKVLRGTKALQIFEYNFSADISFSSSIEWQPALILQYLLLYASHSLVSLDLTGMKGCSWNVCGSEDRPYTETPRHFQVLKQLCVQDGIFIRGKGRIGSPQSATKPWWSITKIYEMADVLPASLEQLTLFPSFDHRDQISDAFRDFPELKEHKLPRLKEIKLGGGLQLDESMKLACEKVGTSVVEFSQE